MTIQRGVSLYSYQQAQFFRELTLEDEIREVGTNLNGATGIEIVDEMSLHYPDPGDEFVARWFGWMQQYGTTPVAMDVGLDTLQFRDHVMTYEEAADRLRHDIRLAKRLGFRNVRTLSVVPLEVLAAALPVAEELDIRLGKEVHQPMTLEGQQVTEILDYVARTGTKHLGIVPDFGIFQFKPSEVQLANFERRGAKPEASEAVVELAEGLHRGEAPFEYAALKQETAGTLRSDFTRYLNTGDCAPSYRDAFVGVKAYTEAHVPDPQRIDYVLVFEALMLSDTSTDTLRQLAADGHIVHIHGKFNYMSEIPGHPGQYQEASIDYAGAIAALKAGDYDGYIDTEYEGQRYLQDLDRDQLMDEVDQVRRHQEMLARLIAA